MVSCVHIYIDIWDVYIHIHTFIYFAWYIKFSVKLICFSLIYVFLLQEDDSYFFSPMASGTFPLHPTQLLRQRACQSKVSCNFTSSYSSISWKGSDKGGENEKERDGQTETERTWSILISHFLNFASTTYLFIYIPLAFSLQKLNACDRRYVLNRLKSICCLVLYQVAYLVYVFINCWETSS